MIALFSLQWVLAIDINYQITIYLANTINSQIRIMFISYAQMTNLCDFLYIKINYVYAYTCVWSRSVLLKISCKQALQGLGSLDT